MLKRFSLLLFLVQLTLHAGVLRPGYEGVRPVGMGDAFSALVDDHNALFYNPAGLAKVSGLHFNLFDFKFGADSTDSANRMKNAFFKGDFKNLIRMDREFARFAFSPTLIAPNFGVSLFNDGSGYFNVKNPTTEGIDVYGYNDLGIIAGFSIPMGDQFSIGMSAKLFQRTGVDQTLSAQEVANNVVNSILNGEVYDVFKDSARTGWGVAMQAGALARVPLRDNSKNGPKLFASFVVDNVGTTTFKPLTEGNLPPDSIHQSFNLGLAYQSPMGKNWTWNVTSDVKHFLETIPFVKQFHFGTEFRHKVFALRAGVSEGYPSFGLSLEFPPHTRLHLATYAKELTDTFNSTAHRWYMVQLIIGFNPF